MLLTTRVLAADPRIGLDIDIERNVPARIALNADRPGGRERTP
ncbi:MAG TPA: hypothetical protein VGL75_05265 [Acidothermaceae bacterium]